MRLPNSSAEYLLSEPEDATNAVAIFLPGMSGGALDEKYDSLAQILNDRGISLLRLQCWSDKDDLNSKSFKLLQEDILSAVSFLKSRGYIQFYGIGKSLGASALFFAQVPELTKLVLWAPIIHPSGEATLETLFSIPFSKIASLNDVTVSVETLESYVANVLLVWGTEDVISNGVDLKKVSELLPNGNLFTIPGMGHTPTSSGEWEELFLLSAEYIKEKGAA